MKIISLNIWCAQIFEPLMDFFERNQEVDVFCLQEVFNGDEPATIQDGQIRVNSFTEIARRLPGHVGYFAPAEEAIDDIPPRGLAIPTGLAMFVGKDLPVLSHRHEVVFDRGGEPFSSENPKTHRRVAQTICVPLGGRTVAVSNFHGLWNGQGKTDTPDRLEQSRALRRHTESFKCPVALLGDFNLLPDTESLAVVAAGMRNLIAERGVTSTRSSLYTKHEKPVLFADYAFTSPEIEVVDFRVLPDVVSDHLPLSLEIR